MPIKSANNLCSHFYQFCNIVVNCNNKNNPNSSLLNRLTVLCFVIVAVIVIIAISKKHSKKMDESLHFYNSMYKKAKALSTKHSYELRMETNSWTDAQFFFANFIIKSIEKSNKTDTSVENITIDNLFYLKSKISTPNILLDVLCNNIPSMVLILVAITNPNELPAIITILTLTVAVIIKIAISKRSNKDVFEIVLLTDNLLEKVCHALLKNPPESKQTEAKKVCLEFFGDSFEDVYKKCAELKNKEENGKNPPTAKKINHKLIDQNHKSGIM